MTVVLDARGVSVNYGGVRALVNVDFAVGEGNLVGLIGPNGAGKTTFIDALTGFASCSGIIELDGFNLMGLAPHQRARCGIARTWQSGELFDDLTVRENLAVATGGRPTRELVHQLLTGRRDEPPAVASALDEVGIEGLAESTPDQLTQGQRKLVGVARALAAEPRVVCLDEPAAGLNSDESLELGNHLRRLVDNGASMLLIDHDMGLVLSICDTVVVLEFGEVIARGTPDEVRRDPRVIEAYLGEAAKGSSSLEVNP